MIRYIPDDFQLVYELDSLLELALPPTETTLLTLNFLIEAGRSPFAATFITMEPYPDMEDDVGSLVPLSGLGRTLMGI